MAALPAAAGAETVSFRYDSLGRLTSSFRPDGAIAGLSAAVTYDRAGNRASATTRMVSWVLMAGQSRVSADGRFQLSMQGDGNLVLYQGGVAALWATGTAGPGNYVQFQPDGNLVVYNASAAPVWSAGVNSPAATLTIRNDGDMEIVSEAGQRAWHSNSCCH